MVQSSDEPNQQLCKTCRRRVTVNTQHFSGPMHEKDVRCAFLAHEKILFPLTEALEKDLFCTLRARRLQCFLRLGYTTIINTVVPVTVRK